MRCVRLCRDSWRHCVLPPVCQIDGPWDFRCSRQLYSLCLSFAAAKGVYDMSLKSFSLCILLCTSALC